MANKAKVALEVLGAVGSILGIGSFFGDALNNDTTDTDILNDLAQVKGQLDRFATILEGTQDQILATATAQSASALNAVQQYVDGDSGTDFVSFKASAIELSNLGLNSAIQQTKAIMGSASMETLANAFGAIQYAMHARQMVANVMQDGPLGAPGLHQQIKDAAALLFDTDIRFEETDRDTGLVFAIQDRIPGEITQTAPLTYDGSQAIVRITTTSETTGHTQTNTVAQEGDYGGWFGTWRLTETTAEFNTRVAARKQELLEDVVQRDTIALDIAGLKEIASEAHQFLSYAPSNVHNYEDIGDFEDDVFLGTSRSDYLSGRDGDDELWGGREDVTGGNDGPDNLSGGAGNDILRGGDMSDLLRGGTGNDFIIADDAIGQMGTGDVARLEGLGSDYIIDGGTTYATVTSLIDGSRDKLFGVEFLRFDNGVRELGAGSALDDAGEVEDFVTAESVALLYEAALDRSDGDGIDRSGLNFYIDVAEALMSERGFTQEQANVFIAEDLMTSPEFTENFGDVNTLTAGEFVDQIYQNVLGRPAESTGRDFYISELTQAGKSQAEVLADIAISPENAEGSTEVLMSLYEASTPETHPTTGIVLDWYFVA